MSCIRPALNSDGPAILTIMAECFLQFPGCYFELGENKDVQAPASTYAQKGGLYLVLQNDQGGIDACAGIKRGVAEDLYPAEADWELSRFYVRPSVQAQGVGSKLLSSLLGFAVSHGGGSVVAWSDTRFVGAHAFYQKHGMQDLGHIRPLYDISHSEEYAFYKVI